MPQLDFFFFFSCYISFFFFLGGFFAFQTWSLPFLLSFTKFSSSRIYYYYFSFLFFSSNSICVFFLYYFFSIFQLIYKYIKYLKLLIADYKNTGKTLLHCSCVTSITVLGGDMSGDTNTNVIVSIAGIIMIIFFLFLLLFSTKSSLYLKLDAKQKKINDSDP
jgi:hypothetical protein